MEIFTNREGEIILKKYSPIGEIDSFAKQYAESEFEKYRVIQDRLFRSDFDLLNDNDTTLPI